MISVTGSYVGAKKAWGTAAGPKTIRYTPMTPSRRAAMIRDDATCCFVRTGEGNSGVPLLQQMRMTKQANAKIHSERAEISSQK